ncbi:ATP synthase F0 subunit A [PVC group bacterium (ex Bugula neritina AB1)]|nr:ATP synthase F0 subunit A [PVC group bacterium (ex Bugula neritina AB1)]
MDVGAVHKSSIQIPRLGEIVFNDVTWRMIFIVLLIMIVFSFLSTRKLKFFPSKKQSLLEMFVGGFFSILEGTLKDRTRKYFPFVATVFLFILVSNIIGIIPGMSSPTEDLNVCLSLALTVFFVAHFSGICTKGLGGYLKSYGQPFIFMLPLNVIGEIGQTLSHCFRLFGNMFGGGVIFGMIPMVVFKVISSVGGPDIVEKSFSQMGLAGGSLYALMAPVISILYFVAYAFFGLFAGFVQAFVFAMLATTYISMQLSD